MNHTVQNEERYSIFNLEEDNLNSLLAPELKSRFIFLKDEGVRNLVLDLSKVKFVDSSGLSAILTGNRQFKNEGTFVLTGVEQDSVKRLIEISRLDAVLTIIPTVSESVDFILMEEMRREIEGGEEDAS